MKKPLRFRSSVIYVLSVTIMLVILGVFLTGIGQAFGLMSSDTGGVIGLVVTVGAIVATWLYYATLRIVISEGAIESKSIFGSRRVKLDEHTLVRYRRVRHRHFAAMIRYTDFHFFTRLDYTFHRGGVRLNLTVSDPDHRINITHAIWHKGPLFEHLRALELDVILPDVVKRLEQGERVALAPFEFQGASVRLKQHNAKIPLDTSPLTVGSKTSFVVDGHSVKVPTDNIENPYVVAALLGKGLATTGPPSTSGQF